MDDATRKTVYDLGIKKTEQNAFWHSAPLELKELMGLLPTYKYRLKEPEP